MPPTKYLVMILIILASSCHPEEQRLTRRITFTGGQTLLIDSAHPFYPYVDSSLPFVISKERVTIYGIKIHLLPALYPPCYGIELMGKGWLPPELGYGDSAPIVIDSPAINWPNPPRQPRAYHF